MSEVDHFLAVKNKLGEGPVWNPAEQALYWVDIESNCYHRLDSTTGAHEVFPVGLPIGALALRASGGLVMATKRGFAFWDWQKGLHFIADPEADKLHTRFNDGAVDCQGRFWAGTMCDPPESCDEPGGCLYRLDADESIRTMQRRQTTSNGPGCGDDPQHRYPPPPHGHLLYVYACH